MKPSTYEPGGDSIQPITPWYSPSSVMWAEPFHHGTGYTVALNRCVSLLFASTVIQTASLKLPRLRWKISTTMEIKDLFLLASFPRSFTGFCNLSHPQLCSFILREFLCCTFANQKALLAFWVPTTAMKKLKREGRKPQWMEMLFQGSLAQTQIYKVWCDFYTS